MVSLDCAGSCWRRLESSPRRAVCYDFPGAVLKVYGDGTIREFPRWCQNISVARSREYLSSALRSLRAACRAKDQGQDARKGSMYEQ